MIETILEFGRWLVIGALAIVAMMVITIPIGVVVVFAWNAMAALIAEAFR